jgi:hypothetical protein
LIVQTLAIVFVVVALGAIAWRFLPRSPDGPVRLPRVVDDSIGMYLLRRTLGRPTERTELTERTEPTRAPDRREVAAVAEPRPDEIAPRVGVTSSSPQTASPGAAAAEAPSGVLSVALEAPTGADGRRLGARPTGALAAQRRWAGAVALAVVAVALVTLALGTRQNDGGVLSATGTPGGAPTAANPSASASMTAH